MAKTYLISSARPRVIAALSLPLLAALAGACGDSGSDGGGGGSATAASGGSTEGGPGSGSGWTGESGTSDEPSATTGWDDSGAPTGGASSASGGEPGEGTTGGDEPPPDPGENTSSSTGDTTTGEPVCDMQTPVVLYLSPDDSNSTSSPVQAREAVLSGWGSLTQVPIRTWEFLNYYSFEYAQPEAGQVSLTPEVAPIEGADQFVVQIGVASEHVSDADRPLMNVTLVLDESGSMGGLPIELEREVCRTIAASLRAGDVVSAVGWDTMNAVKLTGHVITKPSDPVLVDVCDNLAAGGGTDLHGGLSAGYDLAEAQYDPGRINRVVLISDGGANAGITEIDIIAAGAGSQDEDGVYLVGVGVGGPDTYHDDLMDTVTDVGRGASLFIPSKEEAHKMFGERFIQTMAVAVRDVRVRLDLPPGFSIVKFSGEEYSSDPAEIEPQHLAPNDAMVFHQTVETCAPELVDEFTVAVRWKDPISFADQEITVSKKFSEAVAAPSPMLSKGAAVYAYAEGLKEWRKAPQAASLAPAFAALAAAEAQLPGDADLAEIRAVLEKLAGK